MMRAPALAHRPALAVAVVLTAGLLHGCGGDEESASGSPSGSDASDAGVTGTVTFDGEELPSLERLSCVVVPGDGDRRIAGEVGDGGWLQMEADYATYEDGDVRWVTTSGDNRGSLEVTEDGAAGTLLVYEEGTANDPGDQEFFELTVDVTC